MVTEEQIVAAAQTLATNASAPATVVLFGSHARGDASGKSDVDFLVIEDELHDQVGEYVRLRKAIRGMDSAVDILVVSRARAEERRQVPGSVIRAALRDGKVLVGD